MNATYKHHHFPTCGVTGSILLLAVAMGIVAPIQDAFGQGGAPPQYGPPTDVEFKADLDGTPQRYMELLPVPFDSSKAHDLLMVFHGHGAPRSWYVQADDAHARATRDTAARHQMIFISPDYRASTSWMGPAAEADVVQIIQDLRRKYKIGKVFLMGNSMGGSSVLTFTALHPEMVDGAIAIIPTANHLEYRNFQEAIAASFGGTKQQVPLEYKKRSAEYWPERFTMPLAIVTGANDTAVPPQSAMRLAGVLEQMGRKVLAVCRPGKGHECSVEDTVAAMEFVFSNAVKKADQEPPAAVSPPRRPVMAEGYREVPLGYAEVRPRGLLADRINLSLNKLIKDKSGLTGYLGWGADQIGRWIGAVSSEAAKGAPCGICRNITRSQVRRRF